MSDSERDPKVDETVGTGDQDDDTEGQSLFIAELGRTIAGDRSREAAQWSRGEAARRQAKKDPKPKR
jgi:hypothetical protein